MARKKKKSKKESKRSKVRSKTMRAGKPSVSALKRTGPRTTKKAYKKKGK